MDPVLVDTDVFSYLFKGDTRAALYRPHLNGKRLHLAFSTVAELYRWAVKNGWGRQRIDSLRLTLRNYVVLPYDDAIAWNWAEVMCIPGHPVSHGDAWVAATALRHQLTLVTNNRKDFEPMPNLQIISES
jgi:tRNA(fMet)-specific endonuclease VapC